MFKQLQFMVIPSSSELDLSIGYRSFNGNYENYFFKELIPYIESNYSTDTSNRQIGGNSMVEMIN